MPLQTGKNAPAIVFVNAVFHFTNMFANALTFPDNWNCVYRSWKAGEITAKTAMEQTGTKRTSFYKLVGMTEE